MDLVIAIDDPRIDDVRTLLDRHLAFAREITPPDHVHAMEVDDLLGPAVTFFSARRDGVLLGVGALKRLDETHAELKSMHTSEAARGEYTINPHSACMTIDLAEAAGRRRQT